MNGALQFVLPIVLLAVVIVLMIGVGGFGIGGVFNRNFGNRMMRLRIILQVLAVILIVALVALQR